jgi:DNA-binding response OmpR family regulator
MAEPAAAGLGLACDGTPMRILLVEDDPGLGRAVGQHLRQAGHAVEVAATCADADLALRQGCDEHELVLLDLGLPDGRGIDLLRQMRARQDWRPVVITTARDQISDRIAGLQAGADDYLVKPFDLGELQARISAVYRRAAGPADGSYHHGEVTLRLADRRAEVAGREVALTAREWAILDHLLRRPGSVVSRAQIEDALGSFGADIESNAVEVYVSRLRKKLGAEAIQTLRGIGYRMPA